MRSRYAGWLVLLPLLMIISSPLAENEAEDEKEITLSGIEVAREPWAGIDDETREKIEAGEIVILSRLEGEKKKALIQSALIFNAPLDQAWRVITDVDTQQEYLPRLQSSRMVEEKQGRKNVEFLVKVAFVKVRYRVVHRMDDRNHYMDWNLDPSFDNEMRRVDGFWKFFALSPDRTLARYGTKVETKISIPSFMERYFAGRDIPEALGAVRRRVESGGTWKKPD